MSFRNVNFAVALEPIQDPGKVFSRSANLRKMPILRSCCCWKSVRNGSIACGVYTLIYYTVNAIHSFYALAYEICFYKNHSSIPLIDINGETIHVFSHLIFVFSSCGIISTILLFCGLYMNIKYLLIPWIFNMVFFTILDIIYVIHALVIHSLKWSPSVGMVIIVDFFLNTLNLYALLCVTSQYQEYQATNQNSKAIDTQISTKNPAIINSQSCNKKPKKTVNFDNTIELSPK